MTVIRIPDVDEILGGPWALLLRSGGTGLWLLRGLATEHEEVDTRIVYGPACATRRDAREEWARALECEQESLYDCLRADGPRLVLVADAERLLDDEPERLPDFLDALRKAAAETQLRVVFQSRFEHADEKLAVFQEFGVEQAA